jgi:hypothetical protein
MLCGALDLRMIASSTECVWNEATAATLAANTADQKDKKMLKYWMIGVAGAAILGAAPVPASAAPASNAAGLRTHQDTSAVEQAARRNGVRRSTSRRAGTHVYGYRNYGDGYRNYGGSDGYAYPEDLPTGSTAWWRSMDFYDRGGFGGPSGR